MSLVQSVSLDSTFNSILRRPLGTAGRSEAMDGVTQVGELIG